ncbi:hypothetical protein BN14_08629 [Rhizoctonia solani AG-1 IB]|uniref:Retrotransposon gag domain-containing protein n=1 Tax=Thanatephorus cucumeris (strain AG1-IB / isolate 7/3/14) TaxID=1108050 RepID=M5CF03_THACB|nr:hypothetical protein BN14_08629 [Rhizoctonia solani AG-1 IB]
MATPSQPTITPGQPQHQGFSAPFREALAHLGSMTMDDLRNLLQRLITSILELSTRVAETEEATKDVLTTVENISQQVNIIAGKVDKPRTPDQGNPTTMVDQTPRPGPSRRQQVKLEPPANIEWQAISSKEESEAEDANPVPTNKTSTPSILAGTIQQSLSCTPGGTLKPINVKALEPFKGGTGSEAKQWLAQMNGATQFNTEEDVVTFLLVNMEGAASSWALPHLANMGSNRATITMAAQFDTALSQAFFDPEKQQVAERKITTLVQTTTAAAYTTKFQTLLMSLDWNDAALHAQFYKGLHWHVKQQLAQKEDQPRDLEALIAAATCIDNVCRKLEISRHCVRTA